MENTMKTRKVRFEVSAKNNRLWKEIYSRYKTMAEFCDVEMPGKYNEICALLNLRRSPYLRPHLRMSHLALYLCEIFHKDPEWLFPPELYSAKVSTWVIESNLHNFYIEAEPKKIEFNPEPKDFVIRGVIDKAMNRLKERYKTVMVLRYGLNGYDPKTLEEVAQILGVCRERVRRMESKAICILKHPKHSRAILVAHEVNPDKNPILGGVAPAPVMLRS